MRRYAAYQGYKNCVMIGPLDNHHRHTSMHERFLHQALELARSRKGFCAPNPAVGAVVVKAGNVVATGTHWAAGHDHAEVVALKKLKPTDANVSSDGATLYVSLEPCCHHGKTPPCTDTIIKHGIKRVIYAFRDPNPVVAGKGELALRKAGIECQQISLAAIERFYASYAYWQTHQRPYAIAKLAMSLDGKIAAARGKQVAISGRQLQQYTHEQRLAADAILTTAQTINQDDPQLNVRLNNEPIRKRLYIVDTDCRLNLEAQLFQTAQAMTVLHAPDVDLRRREAMQQRGVHCHAIPRNNPHADSEGLDLHTLMAYLGEQGIHELWIEAGGRLLQSFIELNLLPKILLYVAPQWLGSDAYSAFNKPMDLLENATRVRWRQLGDDACCEITYDERIQRS